MRYTVRDSNLFFEGRLKGDDDLDASPCKSSEESADQFGTRLALLILCIGFFIAAISVISRPSFEKCSAMESAIERNACYDQLRRDYLRPAR
jgi:hypothetical protein